MELNLVLIKKIKKKKSILKKYKRLYFLMKIQWIKLCFRPEVNTVDTWTIQNILNGLFAACVCFNCDEKKYCQAHHKLLSNSMELRENVVSNYIIQLALF